MAKIRSISPNACKSEKLQAVDAEAERCYWRLLPHCDDAGRVEDDPRSLRSLMFQVAEPPLPAERVDRWLQALHDIGLIQRYQAAGRRYIQVTQWGVYQHPTRPTPSKIPAPTVQEQCDNSAGTVSGHGGENAGNGEGESKRARASGPYAEEFSLAWGGYPRKEARKPAYDAFVARVRSGIDPRALIGCTERFATKMAAEGRPKDKIMHGATFYGPGERWRDYVEPALTPAPDGFDPGPITTAVKPPWECPLGNPDCHDGRVLGDDNRVHKCACASEPPRSMPHTS